MYMGREMLLEKAMDKLKVLSNVDLSTMNPREKALNTTELDSLYTGLNDLRSGSDVAGMVADDCMKMKVKILNSHTQKTATTKQDRAKVIMNGMTNTPYDIPWLKQ